MALEARTDATIAPAEAEETEDRDARSEQETARRESIGIAFFWLVVLAYGFFVPSILSWNSESHLYPAFAIVDHHTLNIDAYHHGLGDKSYWHGHYYTDKAPGLSFLAVPVYAGLRLAFPTVHVRGFLLYKHIKDYYYIPQDLTYLRYAITYLLVSLPSAALAILIWLFLTRISGSEGWSLLLAGVYALGTAAYVYSIWYFSHQLAAVLLFSSFLLLFYKVRQRPFDRTVVVAGAVAGLLAGYSVISEYPTVVIAGLIGLYLLLIARRRWLTAAAFVAGMLPPAALNIWYNIAAYGKPLAMGYNFVHSKAYHTHVHGVFFGLGDPTDYGVQLPTPENLWQITLGTYRGMFFLSPVLLLFFAGVVFMWRRRDLRPEWWLFVLIVVIYFLMDASRPANTNGWSGGSSVTSRHLTPMLPFMIVPIVFGLKNRIFRVGFLATGAISVAIMFMTVSATYLFPYGDQNPLFNEVFPNFFHGTIQANWVYLWRSSLGLTGFSSLLPFFAVVLCLVVWIGWWFRPGATTPGSDRAVAELEAG